MKKKNVISIQKNKELVKYEAGAQEKKLPVVGGMHHEFKDTPCNKNRTLEKGIP